MTNYWKSKIITDFNKSEEELTQSINSDEGVNGYSKYYIDQIVDDIEKRKEFSEIYLLTTALVFEDTLTTLTDIILEKDLGSIKYQLQSELKRNNQFFTDLIKPIPMGQDFTPSLDRMCLFFSIATNEFEIFKFIFEQGGYELLNFRDPVTGITIFHIAMMLGNKQILEYIVTSDKIKSTSFFDIVDSFRATGFDYLKLKGGNTMINQLPPNPKSIQVYNLDGSKQFQDLPLLEIEKKLSIKYTSRPIATNDYFVDLLFSSLSINPDINFRNKYLNLINKSGGEENVILGYINEQVGWGLFAKKQFKCGDYIVRYGGLITMNEKMTTTDYNMMISNEDFGLDASEYRSMGGMINHSSKFTNAESECMFEFGCDQALITATKTIEKGQQIFIDYSKSFWSTEQQESISGTATTTTENNENMIELGGKNDYPSIIKF